VVDDASEDENSVCCKKFQRQKIEYIRGEALARNTGISNARSDFVGFLDDDDE
jgi:glycosyltransferase involved in cell wall biosynthesis